MGTLKVVCKECEKQIDLKTDKHVLLGTYTGEEIEDESYFHFKCFVNWYNQKVSEKAKQTTSKMQEKVQKMISNPQIAGLLGNIGGADTLKGMLNIDLLKGDLPNINDLVDQKKPNETLKENGKPKRKPSTKTTKKKVQ